MGDIFGLARLSRLQRALLQSVLVFVVAVFLQPRWGTIADTSWLISECERILSGESLYVDIIETNPPFSVWLIMPPVIVAHWLNVLPETCVYLYSCLAVVIGLSLAALIVLRSHPAEADRLLPLLPLFVALFVIFPGNAFTERDQLGAVLFLPLLAMMVAREQPLTSSRPGLPLALLAGLSGSVLILVKAYYAVVYVLPALYVVWRRRDPRWLLAPENCVVAVACLVYVALVVWFYPEFIHDTLPRIADVYMGSGNSWKVAVYYGPTYLLMIISIRAITPTAKVTPYFAVALLASLAALLPLIYQGKGWPYHAFTAMSLAMVALLCRIASSDALGQGRERLVRIALFIVVVAVAWRPFWQTQAPEESFVAKVAAASADNASLGTISSDLAAAYPIVRRIGARFPSADACDWYGALALGLSQQASARGDSDDAARYLGLSNAYLDKKYAEFVKYNYDIIVVQRDEPAWTSHVLNQPRFAAFMTGYHQIAQDSRFTVYSRIVSAGRTDG
jgi:hypothetical protein